MWRGFLLLCRSILCFPFARLHVLYYMVFCHTLVTSVHAPPETKKSVECMQMVHVVVLWALVPLSHVGWQACIVDMEEVVLLCMAGALLVWGQGAPTWLKDGMVWMFPVIIATMMIGDGVAGVLSVYSCGYCVPSSTKTCFTSMYLS